MESNNKTSLLISSQVPEFVRQDHPKFIEFMKAYYKFLEQEGELSDVTKKQMQKLDVDLTDDNYRERYFYNFLNSLPQDIAADRNLILKNSKDFLRSRGTEKSYGYLFKILYNKEPNVYYPKGDILRASDGKWFVEKSIRIINSTLDNVSNTLAVTNFASQTIYGAESNASAKVERVNSYYGTREIVTELRLSDQIRQFFPGETVYTFYTDPLTNEQRYLSAEILSGYINRVNIINGGTGYKAGTIIPLDDENGGTGAVLRISQTTTGNLKSVFVFSGGAGYQVGDDIGISGGIAPGELPPSPANANVFTVIADGSYHPNSYSIVGSTILLEANTEIGDLYSNLSNTDANTTLANALSFWTFANTGPINQVLVVDAGANYTAIPILAAKSNTIVRSMGTLGRMEIYDGGVDYQLGDTITFDNDPLNSYGYGANAVVSAVDANGTILGVEFVVTLPGNLPGGAGYNHQYLPTVNIHSTAGHSANIAVTAVLGENSELRAITEDIGKIQKIDIINAGINYSTPPTPNLAFLGDGTAVANTTVFSGAFTYKGRYLNDDGHLSGYNFLQNRDYYQNYSYVIRVNESINRYRQSVNDILHPAGMKMFGEYNSLDEMQANLNPVIVVNTRPAVYDSCTYLAQGSGNTTNLEVNILVANEDYFPIGREIRLLFRSGDTANLSNDIYIVTNTAEAKIYFTLANAVNSTGSVYVSRVLAD